MEVFRRVHHRRRIQLTGRPLIVLQCVAGTFSVIPALPTPCIRLSSAAPAVAEKLGSAVAVPVGSSSARASIGGPALAMSEGSETEHEPRALPLATAEAIAEGEPTVRISLREALEAVRREGPGPILARAVEVEAEAAHARVFEQLLPGISVEGLRRHVDGAVQATLGDIQQADLSTAQLEGSLHLDLHLSNFRAEQAARSRQAAAVSSRLDAERLAQETVVMAYLDIQRGRARLAAAEVAVREAVTAAEVEKVRFEKGQRLKADWLRQKVRASEARLMLLDARRVARLAAIRLSRTLGQDPFVLLLPAEDQLEPPSDESSGNPERLPASELEEFLQKADTERPDVAAARSRVEAEEREVASVRDQALWPSLTFEFRKGILGQNSGELPNRTVYGAWLKWDLLESRGGTVRSRVAQARAHEKLLREELEDLRRRVRGEILEALVDRSLARSRLVSAEDALAAAQEAYEVRFVRAQSGLESGLDLLEAQKDLARARFFEADALADLVTAQLRLRLVVGGTL